LCCSRRQAEQTILGKLDSQFQQQQNQYQTLVKRIEGSVPLSFAALFTSLFLFVLLVVFCLSSDIMDIAAVTKQSVVSVAQVLFVLVHASPSFDQCAIFSRFPLSPFVV
jgi:hypothetical protein